MKHPLHQQTAKFWIYTGAGFVLLRLRPGETLRWGLRHETDEGWCESWVEWRRDDEIVKRTESTDGRDCDGRFSETRVSTCAVGRLGSGPVPANDSPGRPATPDWFLITSGQRDFSAEAAGY